MLYTYDNYLYALAFSVAEPVASDSIIDVDASLCSPQSPLVQHVRIRRLKHTNCTNICLRSTRMS